jgi:hypothetical protein
MTLFRIATYTGNRAGYFLITTELHVLQITSWVLRGSSNTYQSTTLPVSSNSHTSRNSEETFVNENRLVPKSPPVPSSAIVFPDILYAPH